MQNARGRAGGRSRFVTRHHPEYPGLLKSQVTVDTTPGVGSGEEALDDDAESAALTTGLPPRTAQDMVSRQPATAVENFFCILIPLSLHLRIRVADLDSSFSERFRFLWNLRS